MRLRRPVAAATVCAFVFTFSAQTLCAADTHSVTSAQLHQAVQASHARAVTARKAMDDLLARPDVQSQMLHVGLAPSKVRAQVAMLGDTEIVRLHQQMMTANQQQAPAGLSSGAIVAIVAVSVGGLIVLYWLAWHTVNDIYYY